MNAGQTAEVTFPGYEVAARDTDGPIKPCTGLVGYSGDTERAYLLRKRRPHM